MYTKAYIYMCTKEYIYCDAGMQAHTPTYCVGVQRHTPNVWCMCTNAYTIHSPYIKTLKKEEGVKKFCIWGDYPPLMKFNLI